MNEDKLGKLLLFIIGLLIIVTSAIIIGSFFFEAPLDDKKPEPQIAQLNLDDPVVIEAYKLISTGKEERSYNYVNNYSSTQMMPSTIGDEAKLFMAYNYIRNTSQIGERNIAFCDELAGYQYNGVDIASTCNSMGLEGFKTNYWKIYDINYDLLFTTYQKIFGTLIEMPNVSFEVSHYEYCSYSETNSNYLCFAHRQESQTLKKDVSKIVSVSNTEDTIKIIDVYAYCEVIITTDPVNPNINIHKNHKCYINNEKGLLLKEIQDGETLDVSSFGVKYLHTFKKGINDQYYFESSELYQGE